MPKQANTETIWAKLAAARHQFHQMELKKSGKNKFAGYSYFELGDFLVPGMSCFANAGLVPIVYFTPETAVMDLTDIETGSKITFTSPMAEAHLKGCHPIQNAGAVQTYQRRYLYIMALEIVEHDQIDSAAPVEDSPRKAAKKASKSPAKKKAAAKKKPAADKSVEQEYEEAVFAEIESEEGAIEVTDVLIDLAVNMHSDSLKSLIGFWKKNVKIIDVLDNEYPEQYQRLKIEFAKVKQSLEGDD